MAPSTPFPDGLDSPTCSQLCVILPAWCAATSGHSERKEAEDAEPYPVLDCHPFSDPDAGSSRVPDHPETGFSVDFGFLPSFDVDQAAVKFTYFCPRVSCLSSLSHTVALSGIGYGSIAGYFHCMEQTHRLSHFKCFLPQPTGPGEFGGGYDKTHCEQL